MSSRIGLKAYEELIKTPEEAALLIQDGMTLGFSGFTPSGYPKAVPTALCRRVDQGEKIKVNVITGASVGDEIDGAFARRGMIGHRYPYQTNQDLRRAINEGQVLFHDIHLSHLPQMITGGMLPKINIAVVEGLMITKEGLLIPTTSVGVMPQIIEQADLVIVELNEDKPIDLYGLHDIYEVGPPPGRAPIPIRAVTDRVGHLGIPLPLEKVGAIVMTNLKDDLRGFVAPDQATQEISQHIVSFLDHEVKAGRIPKDLLPIQSGVGSVANAVLEGLQESHYRNLEAYTEVIQDAMLCLLDEGVLSKVSGTSLTLSPGTYEHFKRHVGQYRDKIILRPQEISNHPEVIRRLGLISINTALELDIYGHVNSTNAFGQKMINGIGGSGDFARNAYISIFTTKSTAMHGSLSSIVPRVSHVDHTEHDVDIVVTEQGLADLRGKSPVEKATVIIENCAHPAFREQLSEYLHSGQGHMPGPLMQAHKMYEIVKSGV